MVLQLVLLSYDPLDEDEACGVHVHKVVVPGSKGNPVPRNLLWRDGCVKKCRLLKRIKRKLKADVANIRKSLKKDRDLQLSLAQELALLQREEELLLNTQAAG